jgi:TonB family protein
MNMRLLATVLLFTAAAWAQPPVSGERLDPITRIVPAYPLEALRQGISGFVEFEIVVNPDGTVKSARVTRAEPPGQFEASAGRAIREWRFHPRIVDGKAVEYTGTQRIDYMTEPDEAIRAREACEAERQPKRARKSLSPGFLRRHEKAIGAVRGRDYARAEGLARELVGTAATAFEKAAAYQALGAALAGLTRTDEAIAAYQASLETQALPWLVHDQAVFNIAQFHAAAARHDLARQLLEQHLEESCAPHPQARAMLEKLSALPAEDRPPADPPR